MNFVAPELLIGVATALIPLILHLLFRKKPKRMVLPTLRFVRLANSKVLKRHRLRRRLLLLVRMLVLALTAAAMARPFLEDNRVLGTNLSEGDLVVIVDNSYFTAVETGTGTLLEQMRIEASEILDQSTQRSTVVPTCPKKNQSVPILSANKKSAKDFVAKLETVGTIGDLDKALSVAEQLLLDSSEQTHTIVVFSSETRLQNLALTEASAKKIKLHKINPLRRFNVENTAITDLSVKPAPNLGDHFWQIDVEVMHFGETTKSAQVTVSVPPTIEITVPITLKPREKQQTTFQFSSKINVPKKGKITLSKDALTHDNKGHFWLTPEQTIKVLAINGEFSPQPQEDELFYLETVLADKTTQSNAFDLTSVPLEAWHPRKWNQPDVVILANTKELPSTLVNQLAPFVNQGGGLLLTLGDQVESDRLNRPLGALMPKSLRGLRQAGDAAATDLGKDRKPARLEVFDETHPILTNIPMPRDTSISNSKVTNYGLFSTNTGQAAREVIRLDEGAPLLVESSYGRGRVGILSTTIDREWTDLPIQPDFVPMITGLIRFLAQTQPSETEVLTQGETLRIAYPKNEGASFELEKPNQTIQPIELANTEDRWRHIQGLNAVGHYMLTERGGGLKQEKYFSVLPTSEASDFMTASSEKKGKSTAVQAPNARKSTSRLWPIVLLILIILLALESRLAYFPKDKESLAS